MMLWASTGTNEKKQINQAVRELYQGFLIWDKALIFGLKLSRAVQFMLIFRPKMGNYP
jgi:hypothetical protein